MADKLNPVICTGCFREIPPVAPCPHCGHTEGEAPFELALKPGTMLHSHFLVGKVLGKPGGFGITYLAWDNTLETRVAIKEFLPQELAGRGEDGLGIAPRSGEAMSLFQSGLRGFLEEARILARFNHPNIVRVKHYFQENGTAYMVMDYVPGLSLWEHIQRRQSPLGEEEALGVILPVLDGLQNVHAQGFIHRDIKPQNVYLAEDGRSILLDFGTARSAINEKTNALTLSWTPGFAPLEQCQGGMQGPWTDVYGLSATLYFMLTGVVPETDRDNPAKTAIPHLESISPSLQHAIRQGLSPRWQDRPQSMQALGGLLAHKAKPPALKLPPSLQRQPVADSKRIIPYKIAPAPYPSSLFWIVVVYLGLFYGLFNLIRLVLEKAPEPPPDAEANLGSALLAALGLLLYLAGVFVWYRIGRKFSIGSFLGFSIPFYNGVLLCRCANISGWWMLLNAIALYNPDLSIITFIAFNSWIFGAIARRLGKHAWLNGFGCWLVVPVLLLAFDDSKPDDPVVIDGIYEKQPSDKATVASQTIVEFISGDFQGEQIEVLEEGLVIGRNPGLSHLVIDDASISGKHLRISRLPGSEGGLIEDLASTNGSYYRHSASTGEWQALRGSLRLKPGGMVWIRLSDDGPVLKVYSNA